MTVSETETPHTSTEYDERLDRARRMLIEMGARVCQQIADAMDCLDSGDGLLIDRVLQHEALINRLELEIDEFVGQIIARRQPTASDLRALLALIKLTVDIERAGDEAKNIALHASRIRFGERMALPIYFEIRRMAWLVLDMLNEALVSLERMEVGRTAALLRRDLEVDEMYGGTLHRLIAFMIDDPRSISACLDLVFVVRAIERIGDHAKNVAEHVVYAVQGKDLRHVPIGEVERELGA
jgi:phosphate transport system protein